MAVNVEVVANGTNVRRGGSTQGPDNIIGAIDRGTYAANVQCAGGEVVEASGARNFWWVQLVTPVGTGWVCATRIATGGNDQPIPGVPTAPTVFSV